MLLVAVTGDVGSGKSSLLEATATRLREHGRSVDGFVMKAGPRPQADRGADRYDLVWVATSDSLPFAGRVEGGSVPYQFNDTTWERIRQWAGGAPSAEVLFVDELGKLEAQGQGFLAIWPQLQGARVLVAGVRESSLTEIEARIGRPFDLIVRADEPKARELLQTVCAEASDWERIGLYGAASGGLEMSLGSALHGVKFPFVGAIMSSSQCAVLSWAGDGLARRERVVWVSTISAGLKALSPAGSRLGPMLAITVQGILFTLASRVLGWNRFGLFAGGFLAGAWAASQGFFVQYLFMGKSLEKAYDTVRAWMSRQMHIEAPTLPLLILGLAVAYGVVAGISTTLALRRPAPDSKLGAWAKRTRSATEAPPSPNLGQALGMALRDLARPMFWIPVVLVSGILAVSGSKWEESLWVALRAVAVALPLFAGVRMLNPLRISAWLRRRRHWGPAYALESVLGRRG